LCGVLYFVILAIICICCAVLSYFPIKLIQKEEDLKLKLNYQLSENEISFTQSTILKLLGSGLVSGFLTGAIGAGGGTSLVTLFIYIGVSARVASATSGLNNFLLGTANIIMVLSDSMLTLKEIIFFTCLAVIGGLIVAKIVYYII